MAGWLTPRLGGQCMKVKAHSSFTLIFSVIYIYNLLFCSSISYAQKRQRLSSSDLSSNDEIPMVCQEDMGEHQQAFFKQLEDAAARGNEQDLLQIINQFASSGCLFSHTFIEAFSFLASSSNEAAKEKLAEYFTKPMIDQLSSEDRNELCKLLMQSHSKKYGVDFKILNSTQSDRIVFFKKLLHCLRDGTRENLETASLMIRIDQNFMSPRLLANFINQRTPELIYRILKVFHPYELISSEVCDLLSETAKEILADVDLEMLFGEDCLDHETHDDPEDMNIDSEELFSMLGMLVRPKELLEQTVKSAKESPEAMIEACIAAVDDGDQLFFPVLLDEALRMLEGNQIFYLLDYAASSGHPIFIEMVSRVVPNFDQIYLFSAKAKSNLLAAKHSEALAVSITSAYWTRVLADSKLQITEDQEYEQVLEQVHKGLVKYIALEDYPPYSRGDLKTLGDYLLDLINNHRTVFHKRIDSETIFNSCKSWGDKLKRYGLVASMKTQNPYH